MNEHPTDTTGASAPLVLIIDDQSDLARFCRRVLGDAYVFEHASGARAAEEMLASGTVAAVLVDRDFSRGDRTGLIGPAEDVQNEGIHIGRWIRSKDPRIPIIMVTGYREQGTAIEMAKLRCDFLAWQDVMDDPGILHARLQRALNRDSGRRAEDVLPRFRELGMVVESHEFKSTLLRAHEAAQDGAPMLLTGETGTGKDTLAYAIHALTGDSGKQFVSVNVAALNPNLIESELFGYAKGAFTGADRPFVGKLRHAHGGTLFLNEIGELPLTAQAKLLSALEHHEVTPVGDVQAYPARFRLIAASSDDLQRAVEAGAFRRDFYHRVAWHAVVIPPLRERRLDIPPLVRSILRECGQGIGDGIAGIAQEAIDYLVALPWMGNIRELRSVVLEAATATDYFVTLADVHEVVLRNDRSGTTSEAPGAGETEPDPADGYDRRRIEMEDQVFEGLTHRELTARYYAYLYRVCGGSKPEVARRAGIAKTTAYEWKERFGKDL